MQADNSQPNKTSYSFTRPMLYALAVLIVLWLVVAQFSPSPQIAQPERYLGLITLVAIGIERVLEGMWTFVDLTKNSFWPLNLTRYIDDFSKELSDYVSPAVTEIDQALGQASTLLAGTPEKIQEYESLLASLKTQLVTMKDLTAEVKVIEKARVSVVNTLNRLEAQYPVVDAVMSKTQTVVSSLDEYISTIKGNPGRKLVCLFFGAYVGLIAAWIFNLDVILATTGVAAPGAAYLGGWRVAFTGILVGLGASPTHELIRAIQEFKNSQKALAA